MREHGRFAWDNEKRRVEGGWGENRQTDTFLMEMLFFNEQRFKGCAANEMSAVSRIKNSHRSVWENLRGWFDCDAIREC